MTLRTPRLELVPATVAHLEAELRGGGGLSTLLAARVPGSWPPGEYDRDAMAFFHARLREGGPEAVGWYGWYALTRDGGPATLVGSGGFFGPPEGGAVEIGYSVIPEARGRGFATEIVKALVRHAFATGAVREVRARTEPSNPASSRVLLKGGFERDGRDPETGADRYRLAGPEG